MIEVGFRERERESKYKLLVLRTGRYSDHSERERESNNNVFFGASHRFLRSQ